MELGLRDYYNIIKKRIWLIGLIVFVSTISVFVVNKYFITPVYEASTKLIVVKSESTNPMRDAINMDTVNTSIRLIDTYKEIIKTPRILDEVIKKNPSFELNYNELVGKITVNSVNNTQVMTVVVTDTSYDKAMQIVNAVSKEFQDQIRTIMKVDNVSLLNEAKPLDKPNQVSPRPLLNTAIAIVLSTIISLGLALLLAHLDDTIKSEDDVTRYLQLPTLALIARINMDDLVDKKRNRDENESIVKENTNSKKNSNKRAKDGI